MFCPHCHNKIPDGSNICPLCYANLAGVRPQAPAASGSEEHAQAERKAPAQKGSKKPAYTKGSRGGKRRGDITPMIVAFGLIVILIVIIVLIFRSMFGAGDNAGQQSKPAATAVTQAQNSPANNFIVFGATPTPRPQAVVTATPQIVVTATPAPAPQMNYTTLRKGDQGPDVVTLQQALAELGYLSGAADGNFGTGTQTAVKKFQEAKGLETDGIAGRKTLEALYSEATVTPIPEKTVGPNDIMDLPG